MRRRWSGGLCNLVKVMRRGSSAQPQPPPHPRPTDPDARVVCALKWRQKGSRRRIICIADVTSTFKFSPKPSQVTRSLLEKLQHNELEL